ncbi:MAG: hypothetical protein J0H23_04185 [Micrococcales bacterium]|nr:hypothetical protein [Micrococcales bacterium]OJX66180.1 MAG: hypothetical protein BGO94_04510 [Micrococcales bacterium 72-143]
MTDTAVVPPSPVVRGIRRAAIIAIIASLAVAALLGIIALLSGEFGELQGRVLLTTLTVAAFGTTALCHLAIVTRAVRVVGFVGIAASAGAALCAFVLIWVDWGTTSSWDGMEPWLKAFGVLTVVAVSLAQANLLLLLAGRPHRAIRIALAVTLVTVVVVAVMIILPIVSGGEIPGDHGEPYWRALGVVGILDALGTIALPILGLVLRRAPVGTAAAAAHASGFAVELDGELLTRLDERAARDGVSRDVAARDAVARGLDIS